MIELYDGGAYLVNGVNVIEEGNDSQDILKNK